LSFAGAASAAGAATSNTANAAPSSIGVVAPRRRGKYDIALLSAAVAELTIGGSFHSRALCTTLVNDPLQA
jgi:hypothetical protein